MNSMSGKRITVSFAGLDRPDAGRSKEIIERFQELRKSSTTSLNLRKFKHAQSILPLVSEISTLQSLDLSWSQVRDISSLRKLTKLRKLNISDTRVTDISAVSSLKVLSSLNIMRTKVKNILPLSKISTLESLNISFTPVSDISALSIQKNLRYLELTMSAVGDFFPIHGCISLADAAMADRAQGLFWGGTKYPDAFLRELAHHGNPERTVYAINYLRERAGLPYYEPENYDGSPTLPNKISQAEAIDYIDDLSAADIPNQSEHTYIFENTRGSVLKARDPVRLRDTREQSILFKEISHKCDTIIFECPEENNILALFRSQVVDLKEAMGEAIEELEGVTFWTRANGLRRRRDAEIRLRTQSDTYDDAPLPEVIGGYLDDLIESINVFMLGDEKLSNMDSRSLGPRDRTDVIREVRQGSRLLRAIRDNAGLVSAGASSSLSDAIRSAEETSVININGDHTLVHARETQRNMALGFLKAAVNEIKEAAKAIREGGLREVGAQFIQNLSFAKFVSAYRSILLPILSSVRNSDIVHRIVQTISSLFP